MLGIFEGAARYSYSRRQRLTSFGQQSYWHTAVKRLFAISVTFFKLEVYTLLHKSKQEDKPYPRVRAIRANMGPKTVVKEMSEKLILDRLKKDIKLYITNPKGR